MKKDYFFLSVGNLKHRGLRSWLTILGIFIGIAAVVSLISLGSGLKTAITGQFSTLSVDRLTLQNKGAGFGPPGSSVIEKLNEDDVKIAENIRGVKIVVPRLVRVQKIEFNDEAQFGYVTDLPKEKDKLDFVYDSFNIEAAEGRLLDAGETGKIVIGADVVDDFGDKSLRIGSKMIIGGKSFEVAGILKKAGSFQVNGVIFIPIEDLEEILGVKKEYDLIVIQVQNQNEITDVAESLERELRKDRDEDLGEETFEVQTPEQSLESINTILNIVNIIIIGIAAISLFVGGVGITNTMYTGVLERTKEIGVMKAIGAKNSDVLWIFLIEAGLLGLVGGIVGALIGLGMAFGVAGIANSIFGTRLIDVAISYPLLLLAVLFSFLIGVISGILPASQASKLNVVDALRS